MSSGPKTTIGYVAVTFVFFFSACQLGEPDFAKWHPGTRSVESAGDSSSDRRADAEEVLATTLERAKAEKKKVFVHLAAPS